MIVSRKTAEGLLGKRLKSLGDIDPSKKRRVSYYVLSADGTKNLGGPYTNMDAKKRLRQVEFFKRNPRLSAGMKPSDFDRVALAEGTKIEMEHTDSARSAQRIAMDHLVEDPEYYLKLRAVEGKPGPYRLMSDAESASHGKVPRGNPRPFHQREHSWDEVLIQRGAKKLTRKQILDYYKKNTRNIWPYLKGQTVLVILAPSKNRFVLRRKRPSDERHIKLTKLKGIDDERSFEYWIHRRAVEFHPVLTGKMTPILWLDLDMHTTRSAPARARLLEKMKKAGPKIKRVFRKFGVSRIFVYESGQDGGLHFEGDLRKRQNVDKLRRDFIAALDDAFKDDPVFTTGLAKSGQIRLDTTTFHTLGSLRAPFSMTVTGYPKKRIAV